MSPKRRRIVFGIALVVVIAIITSVLAVACHGCSHKKTDTTSTETSDSVVPTSDSEPTTSESEKPTSTPTPSPTPVPTDTPTPIPTDTPTPTETPVPTDTPTPIPTDTPTPSPKPTKTPKPTKAPTEPTSKPTDPPPPETTPEPPVTTPEPPPETTPEPAPPQPDMNTAEEIIKSYGYNISGRDGNYIYFYKTIYYRGEAKWQPSKGRWRVTYESTPDGRTKYGEYGYNEVGTDLGALVSGITVDE